MLEVSAVASYLASQVKDQTVDHQTIIETTLLHDMGNIVKFKDFISPQMKMGEDYWRKVQNKFIEKYGKDAHQATVKIIKELKLKNEKTVLPLIKLIDYRSISQNDYTSLETRICDYADMCVSPRGIVGFEKRITDLIKRYKLTRNDLSTKTRKENAQEISKIIQNDLEELQKIDFADLIKELSSYDISLKI